MRDLLPDELMDDHFFPLDGQVSDEGVWRILEEHQSAGVLSQSIGRATLTKWSAQNWSRKRGRKCRRPTRSSAISNGCSR